MASFCKCSFVRLMLMRDCGGVSDFAFTRDSMCTSYFGLAGIVRMPCCPLTVLGAIAEYAGTAAECKKFYTACVGAKDYCAWGFLRNRIRQKVMRDPKKPLRESTPFPLNEDASWHIGEIMWFVKEKATISLAELCVVVRKLSMPPETPNVGFGADEISVGCHARINELKKWGIIDVFFKQLQVHLSRSIKENEAAILENAVLTFTVLGPSVFAQTHCIELIIGAMALKSDNYACQLSAVRALCQFSKFEPIRSKLEVVCVHLRWAVGHFPEKDALYNLVLEILDDVILHNVRDENIPAAIIQSDVVDGIVRAQMDDVIRPRVWAWILDHLQLAGSRGDERILSCVCWMLDEQFGKWHDDVNDHRKLALETVLALVRDRELVHKLPGRVLYHVEQIHHYCYEHHATLQLCWEIFRSVPRNRWWGNWMAKMHTCRYIYCSMDRGRVQMQKLTVTKNHEKLPFAGAMLYLERGTIGIENLENCHRVMESLTMHLVAGLEALSHLLCNEQYLMWNVLECVKNLMDDGYTNVRLQAAACSFLSVSASWDNDFQCYSHLLGIHKLVARAVNLFPEDEGLQDQACAVLRQFLDHVEMRTELEGMEVIDAVKKASANYPRALDCDRCFREWSNMWQCRQRHPNRINSTTGISWYFEDGKKPGSRSPRWTLLTDDQCRQYEAALSRGDYDLFSCHRSSKGESNWKYRSMINVKGGSQLNLSTGTTRRLLREVKVSARNLQEPRG